LLHRRIERVHVDVDDLANPPFVHLSCGAWLRKWQPQRITRQWLRCSDINSFNGGVNAMPKKKTPVRGPWTKEDLRQLKGYSKARTPVVDVAKAMKRTEAAVRQKAKTIGIGLGHRRWKRSLWSILKGRRSRSVDPLTALTEAGKLTLVVCGSRTDLRHRDVEAVRL
jgi:hypothetical protein